MRRFPLLTIDDICTLKLTTNSYIKAQAMLSALRSNAPLRTSNHPIDNAGATHTSNIHQKIIKIRNIDIDCIRTPHKEKSYDPIPHSNGRKLKSIKTAFNNNIKSLRKYNISINTQLGPSGQKEMKNAIDERYLTFIDGPWIGKNHDNALQFSLPPDKGNFRVEPAHKNNLKMNTDSMYEFQMRADYAARDVIFFQVKETGGDMKTRGRGRPPLSLHLKNEQDILIAINSENGNISIQQIATLSCPQEWYKFKIRIIWSRMYPCIQVAINGKNVFQTNAPFGAHNSKNHYSKLGLYIPQQKNEDGLRPTSFIFDNVKENHRFFNPKIHHNKVSTHPQPYQHRESWARQINQHNL
ncbi:MULTISPECIES: heparin lyase I family protein [Pseudomonas]|uniref:heparin lyase I family protein n=1 Tax=Pseudomonas TaxID=286 RepID=UPI00099D95AB|nr:MULTISPECIES: heparin lyase I family protein [Pseudomonas]MCK3838892.1 hypothetical protein [Pseudomonas sp. NCIMB 10586]OPB05908.1 hypothetical protein BFW89_09820 [Pseudomonas synxantha]VCU67839.1 hypothetical protein [Pseudomonas synxantha]